MGNRGGLEIILIIALTMSGATALQCYECDSSVDGIEACNDEAASRGELITCPPEESAGCFIVEVLRGETADLTRGCTGITNEELYKCMSHEIGQQYFTACNCHGNECNSDWETAGDTYENHLECFECSSIGFDDEPGGNCSDTEAGGKVRCGPGDTGCFISKSSSSGSDVVTMERGCTSVPCEDRFKCETLDDSQGGTQLEYCNCHGAGCNENWDTANSGNGSGAGVAQPTMMLLLTIVGLISLFSSFAH